MMVNRLCSTNDPPDMGLPGIRIKRKRKARQGRPRRGIRMDKGFNGVQRRHCHGGRNNQIRGILRAGIAGMKSLTRARGSTGTRVNE